LKQSDSTVNSAEKLRQIRKAIRRKYAEVSISAAGKFQYRTGKEGAAALGYAPAVLQDIQPEMLNSFCGVGNPFSIADI